jgi:hypothetical protein
MIGLRGVLCLGLAVSCAGASRGPVGSTGGSGGAETPEERADAARPTGGAGGSPLDSGGGTTSDTGRDVASDLAESPDLAATRDAARDARPDATAADATPAAGNLNDFVFSVECPPGTSGECNIPDARRLKTSPPLQFGGDPGTTYRVRLHFCGPVEGRKYASCTKGPFTNDSLFCMDGTPVPMSGGDAFVDTYPTYEMKVSAPAHSYFVNSRDLRDTLMKIDYSADLEIRGGATITFSTTSRGEITFTSRKLTPAITCPGVPGITQPFNGQFIHVTVQSMQAQ